MIQYQYNTTSFFLERIFYMKRKFFAASLAAVAILSVGCGKTETPDTSSSSEPTTQQETVSKTVEMPDLIGMEQKEAIDQLTDIGLIAGVEYEYNKDAEDKTVIRTSIEAGEQVLKGNPVTLYVCDYSLSDATYGAIKAVPQAPYDNDIKGIDVMALEINGKQFSMLIQNSTQTKIENISYTVEYTDINNKVIGNKIFSADGLVLSNGQRGTLEGAITQVDVASIKIVDFDYSVVEESEDTGSSEENTESEKITANYSGRFYIEHADKTRETSDENIDVLSERILIPSDAAIMKFGAEDKITVSVDNEIPYLTFFKVADEGYTFGFNLVENGEETYIGDIITPFAVLSDRMQAELNLPSPGYIKTIDGEPVKKESIKNGYMVGLREKGSYSVTFSDEKSVYAYADCRIFIPGDAIKIKTSVSKTDESEKYVVELDGSLPTGYYYLDGLGIFMVE